MLMLVAKEVWLLLKQLLQYQVDIMVEAKRLEILISMWVVVVELLI